MRKEERKKLLMRIKALEEGVEDLLCQFAYQTKYRGWPALGTGGLSALEQGFKLINRHDPQIAKWLCCQVIGCREHTCGGTPIPNGYAMMCSKHLNLGVDYAKSNLRFRKECYAPRDKNGILIIKK